MAGTVVIGDCEVDRDCELDLDWITVCTGDCGAEVELVEEHELVLSGHPKLGSNSVPSAPKATTLPSELKTIFTRSTSRGNLNLL
jgi:hypothetical protein